MTGKVKTHGVSIIWFQRDLRLADNPTLHHAIEDGHAVLPVFVLDDDSAGEWAAGGAQRWWLHHSLAALAEDLAAHGAPLTLRRGDAAEIILALAREAGADSVHTAVPVEPWARRQVDRVAKALGGTALHQHRSVTLWGPETIRTKTGGIYGVYTPFARAWRAMGDIRPVLPKPKQIDGMGAKSDRLDSWGLLPTKPDWAGGLRETWQPGEAGGQARLRHFVTEALDGYAHGRNVPGEDLTSMLSPHLHMGEISPGQLWHAAAEAASGEGLHTFQGELIWREFTAYQLWHHPHLPDQPLRPDYAKLRWREDGRGLHAWQRGQTGVPMVDAGMRQLWQTGWMHNRVRMIVASYLVKHLLVSWVAGEQWFWDTLVDADLANNAANWQWVAGSGADAQPFFRIFNPETQGRTHDPHGAYIRRWVPEIAALPDRHLHAPWDAPAAVLAKAGITLGETYPHPLVDLKQGRSRALAAFKAMREAT